MFRPRSVAVVGASRGVSATGSVKLGTAALEHLVAHGFPGRIYPVNPKEPELMGLPCYARLREIPDDVDLALLLVPAEACVDAVRECAAKRIKAAIVFSSGFAEAGDVALQAALVRTAREGGVRLCGPNTAGVVDVAGRLVCSISMVCALNPFREGPIAFITQSGALGGSMLGRGMEQGVGFSHWVSTGNEADLDAADYIEYLLPDDRVKVFALFLEGLRDVPRFLDICRKAARARKPIVVYKTGRSEVGRETARSHTGALAGSDQMFTALCGQFGLVRVDDLADLFPTALAFAWTVGKLPRGPRLGVISASGGVCGVAADECALAGLDIPELTEVGKARIRAFVPAFASVRNPIDVTGQIRSSATGYQDAVRTVLGEDYIDAVLLLVTMAAEPRASFYGREISGLARDAMKPVFVVWTGPVSLASEGFPMFRENRVPMFLSVRTAVNAMKALVDYAASLDRLEATP